MYDENSEIYSSDEEEHKELNKEYEQKIESTKCENKQNPHDEDDFGVNIDLKNFLLRCRDCVVEEYQKKALMVPTTFLPPSKFMKNQLALL